MNKDKKKKQKVRLKRVQEDDQKKKEPTVFIMGEKSPRIRGLNLEKILGKRKKINNREELRSGSLSISLFDDDGEDVMKNVDVGILDVGAAEKVNIKKNKVNKINKAKKNGKQMKEDGVVFKDNAGDNDEGKEIKNRKDVKATQSVGKKETIPMEEGKVEKSKQKAKPQLESATKSVIKPAKKEATKLSTKGATKSTTKTATKATTKSAAKSGKESASKSATKSTPTPIINKITKANTKQKLKPKIKSKNIEFSLIDALKIDQSSTSSIEDSDDDVFSLDSPVKNNKPTTTKKILRRKSTITKQSTLKKRKIQFPVSQQTSTQQSISLKIEPKVEPLVPKSESPPTTAKVEVHTARIPLKPSTPSPKFTITTKIPLKDHTSATSNNRRLSLSARGKRLSSIGNGFIATPHKDIPVDRLHEHLEIEVPDPYKIKQLLIWCCKRIRPYSEDQSETNMVKYLEKLVLDEFIDELINGDVNISWWENDDDDKKEDDFDVDKSDRPIIVKENSANVNNSKKLQIFERKVRELEKEEYLWNTLDDNIRVQKYVDELIDIELQDGFNIRSDLNDESDRIFNNILELENTVHKLRISNELIGKLVDYKNKMIANNLKKAEKDNNNVIKLLGKLY